MRWWQDKRQTFRRVLLRRYRWAVVRPAIRQREQLWFQQAATKVIPTFNLPFSNFQALPQRIPLDLLSIDFTSSWWQWYRTWALVRISGKWPATIYGSDEFPALLPNCIRCNQTEVDVLHPLCFCPLTVHLFEELKTQVVWTPHERADTSGMLVALFGPQHDRAQLQACVSYVVKTVCPCMAPQRLLQEAMSADDDMPPFSASRFEALARHEECIDAPDDFDEC